jgi:hypothetical protein
MNRKPRTDAKALAIAAYAAPRIRSSRSGRVVKTESGKQLDLEAFQAKVFERAGIEFDSPWRCPGFGGEFCTNVAGDGARSPAKIRSRKGQPWRCRRHAGMAAAAAMTPEQRKAHSEAVRKGRANQTPDQRSEPVRKWKAAQTPHRLSEIAYKGQANRTFEQRREAACKGLVTRTTEQRREASRKVKAAMTPEQRSEASRKAYANRAPRVVPTLRARIISFVEEHPGLTTREIAQGLGVPSRNVVIAVYWLVVAGKIPRPRRHKENVRSGNVDTVMRSNDH